MKLMPSFRNLMLSSKTSDGPGAPYGVRTAIISDLGELHHAAKTAKARASLDDDCARYGMINLSRLREQVEAKLIHFSQVRE